MSVIVTRASAGPAASKPVPAFVCQGPLCVMSLGTDFCGHCVKFLPFAKALQNTYENVYILDSADDTSKDSELVARMRAFMRDNNLAPSVPIIYTVNPGSSVLVHYTGSRKEEELEPFLASILKRK